ncbi:MAG: SRPBCC family protein [Fimbriimonas sp.]|nr:SRPBCC family protein [Fimbriimonas sp.]
MGKRSSGYDTIPPAMGGFLGALGIALVGVVLYGLASKVDSQYGWAVFVGLPIVLGFACAWIVSPTGELTYRACAATTMWALLFTSLGLVCLAWEGIVCLLMAAPLEIPLALLGAGLGFAMRRGMGKGHDHRASVTLVVGMFPLLLSSEVAAPPGFVEHSESTTIVIDAPPEKVWPYVGSLENLPPAKEWLFRAGIAHPMRVDLPEPWVGGRRYCRLSTGDMPERVEVIEPNLRFAFRVLSTPEAMRETSPWGDIHPAHLKGYFESRRGEFDLERLSGGRTRLIGTSWYASRIAPDPYWSIWTSAIIEQVHQRVMREIKLRAERLR